MNLAAAHYRATQARVRSSGLAGLGGCGCRPPSIGDLISDAQAQAEGYALELGAQGAAQLQASTGISVSAQSAQGAQAAADLATHGFNPDDPADRAKMIHCVAGGLALIPGPGPLLAGAVEALYAVGSAIACPVTHLFGGTSPDCGDPPCVSSGPPMTAARVLALSEPVSAPPGSFAELVTGALALHAADAWSCKGSVGAEAIVVACANMWNATHEGPAVAVYVPPLDSRGLSSRGIWPSAAWWSPAFAAGAFAPTSAGAVQGIAMQIAYAKARNRPPPATALAELADPATDPSTIPVNQGPLHTRVVALHLGGGGSARGGAAAKGSGGGGVAVVGLAVAGAASGLAYWLTRTASGKRAIGRMRRLGRKR